MKENEAPEKIYIHPNIGGREFLRPWLHRAANNESIEYIRANVVDDLITKSAVWFANRYQANGSYLCANDTEDYVQQMKEYLKTK